MTNEMENDRWTVKNKLAQFKSITHLHERTVTHTKELTKTLRKKQGKEIKSLNKQNKKYRQDYGLGINGDREKLIPVLQNHPTLQLAYQNMNPNNIEEDLKQLTFSEKKELDRLRYKKKQKEEEFLAIKLELVELQYATTKPTTRVWKEQELLNEIDQINVKQNAAASIKEASFNMINILKKDTIRFDQVLEELKKDSDRQCQCILKATKMGQDATQELAKLQEEYNITEKHVRNSMKERDRAIRIVKADIENVKSHHAHNPKLDLSHDTQRAAAVAQDGFLEENVMEVTDALLGRELKDLSKILMDLQDVTLVQKFQDIFSRMMEQLKNKSRLQHQVDLNEEQKSRILKLRSSMDVLLEVVLYHTLTEEAIKYQNEKKDLTAQISEENKIIVELNNEIKEIGEMILQIRTALITLNILLSKVCPLLDELSSFTGASEHEFNPDSEYAMKPLTQPKTDALYVLEKVTEKLKWVMNQISKKSFGLSTKPKAIRRTTHDSIGEDILEDEYDTIVTAMLDELSEVDDPSVPTRKDIKAQSRKIVEQFEDPMKMFKGPTGPQFKKHKCF